MWDGRRENITKYNHSKVAWKPPACITIAVVNDKREAFSQTQLSVRSQRNSFGEHRDERKHGDKRLGKEWFL
jgi:hypothetical protein